MRLPKIELVKFNGDIKDWLKFWSQFKRIHENENMHKEDKFQYLIQSMVEGTRVRDLVDGYPPTAENYDKCMDSLRMRFGREELLIEFYVRELLSLVIKNVTNSRSKGGITQLYDQLESHLRSLESIGMTSDKYAAMLLPLVESCIPEDMLRIWLRSPLVSTEENTYNQKLTQLLKFLRLEVESEQRVLLAKSGFKQNENTKNKTEQGRRNEDVNALPTSAVLLSTGKEEGQKNKCLFCSKTNHKSLECYLAQKMSLADRKSVIVKNKACFKCLKEKHGARFCRNKSLSCGFCGDKWHHILLCPKKEGEFNKVENESPTSNTLSNQTQDNVRVYLQTVPVKVCNGNQELVLRGLLDSGSENSYVSQRAVSKLHLKSCGKQTLIHGLFGGRETAPKQHDKYNVKIKNLKGNFSCQLELLSEEKICGIVPKITKRSVIAELEKKKIYVPDVGCPVSDIDLLIGADNLGLIYTGKLVKLECGITVVETHLGSTLMGKGIDTNDVRSLTVLNESQNPRCVMNMFSSQILSLDAKELWSLETLGIRDPIEVLKGKELNSESMKRFEKELDILPNGRYQVSLPFKIENSLSSNKHLTWKRHQKMCQGIIEKGCYEDYVAVFKDWERLEVIERVPEGEINNDGYYLPHRPVLTPTKNTKIRPVFDATARVSGKPSLNDVLDKGPSLVELIPDIMDRFRLFPIGLSADIEKAFLQLSISPQHRDFLRFFHPLGNGKEIIYRHCRVVFGVSSSPFLLGASLHHLFEQSSLECSGVISKLKHSFYVDNCVSGVFDEQEIGNFISSARAILAEGCFNLRNWECNVSGPGVSKSTGDTNLLGITWNLDRDTLRCSVVQEFPQSKTDVTKRTMLSFVQQFFDPIGILSAATLMPKLWLQEAWKGKLTWDDPLPPEMCKRFARWLQELTSLNSIEIPRYVNVNGTSELHVFVDASKNAYAGCIFVRTVTENGVQVYLIRAKTRVAPIKTVSIARLELLACGIGARLARSVQTALDLPHLRITFWTDSMVALWWISNRGEWSVFVSNRVKEINEVTSAENWRHVPGKINPADVLSRGCSPQQLLDLKWYEGPTWLKQEPEEWPLTKLDCEVKEVNAERRKVSLCNVNTINENAPWYAHKFSNYHSIIRLVAWIKRFIANCRKRSNDREVGELSSSEILNAEMTLIRSVQKECFPDESGIPLINVIRDNEGVMRVKTRITERNDDPCFLTPILLPANCALTERLIEYIHKTKCHAGTQMLLSIIREKYWILKSRKTVRKIVRRCVVCRRYSARPAVGAPVALPKDRVKDTNVFQVTGIDLAGPLFLLNGDKVWIVLYTCAVFRAVHLELVPSLSTASFLLSLRRFIARRGRPETIYTDNGTNFRGAVSEFQNLDWDKIERETELQGLKWKFIPPTAAWWGGWWERLVRVVKDLLKRTLGRAILSYEELLTVCCECEAIINSRPLTYLSEDSEDLVPITPAMFLMTNSSFNVTDFDLNDFAKLQRRVRFRAKLFTDLKGRFRKEYLGLLAQNRSKARPHEFKVGEIVLVESPNKKRLYWPLAKVVELLPGKDGHVRTLKLKCGSSVMLRPVQRVFSLEIQPEELPITSVSVKDVPESLATSDDPAISQRQPFKPEVTESDSPLVIGRSTRCGRKVNPPQKLDLLNLTLFFES